MKFSTATTTALLALTTSSSVSAFAPISVPVYQQQQQQAQAQAATSSSLKAVAGAAASYEEDLALTLKAIMDHQERSTTTSKEQMIAQMEESAKVKAPADLDVSVPYDAAAELAYQASDKSMTFDDFKVKYYQDTVAYIKAKSGGASATSTASASSSAPAADVSVPYDANAMLAYEASDKSMKFEDFKVQYYEDTVAYIKGKNVDLSIPYDAAAKLAYEAASDKSMKYEDFKAQFEADAVADVIAKNGGGKSSSSSSSKSAAPASSSSDDVSVPYDAAAMLAYEASDKKMSFEDFKAKYYQDTVAYIKSKQAAPVSA